MKQHAVEEVPGLYGPVRIPERLLQQIWSRSDFDSHNLVSIEGHSIKVISCGKWNVSHEGPDFLGAEIEIDGRLLIGDVEIHFNRIDWLRHGHDKDSNFRSTILHVVLFAEDPPVESCRSERHVFPPTLVLLPLLFQSLEEYAEQDALETLNRVGVDEAISDWLSLPLDERKSRLLELARQRWVAKLNHARERISSEGWTEACHQFALEILGYRRNRVPMSTLSLAYPFTKMSRLGKSAKQLFDERVGEWKLAGLRPANHPLARLRQYLKVIKLRPNWPMLLTKVPYALPEEISSRKLLETSALRQSFSSVVLGGAIGGTRLETLVADGFLPLLSAKSEDDLFYHWHLWYAGDFPEKLKVFLRESGVAGPLTAAPYSNGFFQGALAHFIERNLI